MSDEQVPKHVPSDPGEPLPEKFVREQPTLEE